MNHSPQTGPQNPEVIASNRARANLTLNFNQIVDWRRLEQFVVNFPLDTLAFTLSLAAIATRMLRLVAFGAARVAKSGNPRETRASCRVRLLKVNL